MTLDEALDILDDAREKSPRLSVGTGWQTVRKCFRNLCDETSR